MGKKSLNNEIYKLDKYAKYVALASIVCKSDNDEVNWEYVAIYIIMII